MRSRRRVVGGLVLAGAVGCGGCASGFGVREGPTIEEISTGIAEFGASLAMSIGLVAAQGAGGDPDNGSEMLYRPEHRWDSGVGSGW